MLARGDTWDPVTGTFADPAYARRYADQDKALIHDDHWAMSSNPVIVQALWTIMGEGEVVDGLWVPAPRYGRDGLTARDRDPEKIDPAILGCFNDGVIGPLKEISFTAPSREEAIWLFMEWAKENRLGDGMQLIPPERHLVEQMLATTTRDRNDVIGRMYVRGGAMTVETLATIAAMVGVRPNAFPVALAFGEALGMQWEEGQHWWHLMTGNTNEVAAFVSGPVVDEIGMSHAPGQGGAGHEVNNALGRFIRMLWRNVARNTQPNLDISTHTHRATDPVIVVLAENYKVTKELGWTSHSEDLGFGPGSSSVSISSVGNGTAPMSQGWQADWTVTNMTTRIPASVSNTAASTNANSGLVTFSPAQARLLAATYPVKQVMLDSRMSAAERTANTNRAVFDPFNPFASRAPYTAPVTTAFINAQTDFYHVIGNRLSVRHAAVVGEDPTGGFDMLDSMYVGYGFVNSKVSGGKGDAAPSTHGVATAPSAPRNFEVSDFRPCRVTPGRFEVTLTWDAPADNGGRDIYKYQVYFAHGIDDITLRWLDVPGGAAAREAIFTNLLPGVEYEFKVRAVNDVNNFEYPVQTSNTMMVRPARWSSRYPDLEYFFGDRLPKSDCGLYGGGVAWRLGGRGGWAIADGVTPPGRKSVLNDNTYPQLLGMINPWTGEVALGVLLAHGNPVRGAYGERFFGPNREIWNYLGERIDQRYAEEEIRTMGIASATGAPTTALVTVGRNRTVQFGVALDADQRDLATRVNWTTSNANLATVDDNGLVTIKNMVGTVTLTATDPLGGVTNSIILRIS